MRATCVLWAIQHTDLLLINIDTKSKTHLVSPPNTRLPPCVCVNIDVTVRD